MKKNLHEQEITNSLELLKFGPPKLGDPLYDRIFLSGLVLETNGDPEGNGDDTGLQYSVYIDSRTPLVKLDDKVDSVKLTVKKMAANKNFSLLSSNFFLWITDERGKVLMPLLRRDEGAPTYAGYLTTSAGRCDDLPQKTALAELNQEMLIRVKNLKTNEIRVLGFSGKDETAVAAGLMHKQKYSSFFIEEELMILPIYDLDGPHYYTVNVSSSIIEIGHCLIVFDSETNCYEFCFEGEVFLPKDWVLLDVRDGEGFGREGLTLASLNGIDGEKLVPALKGWLNSKNK